MIGSQVVGTAVAYLDLDTSKFTTALGTAMAQLKTAADSSQDLGTRIGAVGSSMQTVGSQMTRTFTLPIAGAMTIAAKKTMDFEEALSKTQSLAQSGMKDVDAEMAQLKEKAMELGGSTKFTSKEVADAFGYMALAGWKTEDMLAGIDGVLDLAASSGMELATASDIVTDYLSAFGKTAKDTTTMVDMMAYAQANTNTTTEMLGDAFGNSAALMHTAGQEMDTTIALLGAMANEGLKGSQAGTALSATMRDIYQKMYKVEDAAFATQLAESGLTSVTGNMNDLLGKQVIEIGNVLVPVSDLNGNFRDMIDIVGDVEKATNGMATAEKTAALSTTFTSRSIKGMSILLTEGTDYLREFRTELDNSSGTAKEISEVMLDNLAGAITKLKSALDNFLIMVGERLTPYIRKFAEWLTKVTEKISAMSDEEFDNMVKIALWIAALGPLLSIFGKLITVIGGIITIVSKIGPAFTTMTTIVKTSFTTIGSVVQGVIGFITQFITKITGITAVIAGIVMAAKSFFDMWQNGFSAAKEAVMLLGIALTAIGAILLGAPAAVAGVVAAIVAVVATLVIVIKEHWNEIVAFFKKTGENIKKSWDETCEKIKDKFEETKQKIKDKVEEMKKNISEKFEEIKKDISDKVEQIKKNTSEKFEEMKESVKQKVEEMKESIKNALHELKENIANRMREIKDDVTAKIEEIKTKVKDEIQRIRDNVVEKMHELTENVKSKLEEIKNSAHEKIELIRQTAINKMEEIRSNVFSKIEEIRNNLISKLSEIKTNTENNLNELKANVFSKLEEVKNNVHNALETMVNILSSFWQKFKNIGGDLIRGFWDGMVEVFTGLWNWVTDKFGSLLDWVRGVWNDISSFGQSVGSWFNGSHAGGLDYVPFDGYIAQLHKGERVLTKNENEEYSKGESNKHSGGDTYNFYNVKDDPYEYARQMKRTKRELAYV